MQTLRISAAVAFALLTGCLVTPTGKSRNPAAQTVASPDWRAGIVYFAMIDRFDDGDPSNNDQGEGEYDPRRGSHYSGGDLAGLARRLDYLKELGATALWITPPVANQWWNPERRHTGYHGYWASDFAKIDAHYGTLADYRRLAEGLHSRGMHLVQDIVVNHVGDWFGYDGSWTAGDPALGYQLYAEGTRARGHEGTGGQLPPGGVCDRSCVPSCPRALVPSKNSAPIQPPFDQNDPRDPAQRAAAIYHWTPAIRDYQDPVQETTWQMGGLDDLNTENLAVRRALRQSYGHWIRAVGVDAFRVDTIFYVPPAFFDDFLFSDDPQAPGIERVAADSGRGDFLSFGEGFAVGKPFEDSAALKIERYLTHEGGGRRLQGMLNFPLYGALGDAFARGRPTAELARRIEATMRIHARPHRMVNFVDNHDVDRFLAGGSEAALKQALLAMLALPGIPAIWQGTEQGFREQRAAMFAGGYGAQGVDHFDTGSPLFRFLKAAIALRRAHPALWRGVPELLASERAGPGALAWRMRDGQEQLLVAFNTAQSPVLLDVAGGLAPGTRLETLFAIDAAGPPATVGADGRLLVELPARSGVVWGLRTRASGQGPDPQEPAGPPCGSGPCADRPEPAPACGSAHCPDAPHPSIDSPERERYAGDFEVHGSGGGALLKLVVDGDLASASEADVGLDGRWRARIDTRAMLDASIEHRVLAWDPVAGTASAVYAFRVERPWGVLTDLADPRGDDAGSTGRYGYPSDPAWRDERPADIERVRVEGNGGALRLTLTMRALVSSWNPPNGFDHVAFTAYFALPGFAGGTSVLPLQSTQAPGGMRWHYRLRAHGWSNAWHHWQGAGADSEGTAATPGAVIAVDPGARTISFTLSPAALGDPATLSGTRVYITTWDYDGGYRPLAPQAGAHHFGGGPANGPKIMDDALVELP